MRKILNKEFKIGLCVIIALFVLFFGIQFLKGVSIFKPANYYYVIYDNVDGLTPNAAVNLNGYKVGQVTAVDILYERQGQIAVTLSLEKKLQLPKGTIAQLKTGLLGTTTISLDLGHATEHYTKGDTIPGAAADGLMSQFSEQLLPSVNNIIPQIDSLLVNINRVAGNPALMTAVDNIGQTAVLLHGTVQNIKTATGTLPDIIADVNELTASLKRFSSNIANLSDSLSSAQIQSLVKDLQNTAGNLSAFSDKLNSEDGNLGQFINGSGLYENLNNAVADLDSLLKDIKQNPKRYVQIKVF